MKIVVDADACPVKEIIISEAKKHEIEVWMFFNTSHYFDDPYVRVITVDKGRDTVDFALINHVEEGDVVITQDYGVACMTLSKKAIPMHYNGLIFTNENMESLLNTRYMNMKLRHQGIRTKNKRSHNDYQLFKLSLINILNKK